MANLPTLRLFFALWPPPAVAAALQRVATEIARSGGRPMRVETLHMTLDFVGAIAADRLPALIAAAAGIRAPGFTLSLDRLEYVRRKGIVWIACSESPPALAALASDLKASLRRDCGLDPEPRFLAHVTLLRNVHAAPSLPAVPPLAWPVRDFLLVRSETRPQGAHYTEVARWPLCVLAPG